MALSYENKRQQKNSLGSQSTNVWFGALYGLYRPRGCYVLADIAFGGSNTQLKRIITIGSITHKTHSKPKSFQTVLYGEAGFDIQSFGFLIQPFFGLEISTYHFSKTREKGTSGWNLIAESHNSGNVYSRLGVHLTTDPLLCEVGISLDVSWNSQLTETHNHPRMNFENFDSDFSICGMDVNRNSIEYALTFTKYLCCNLEVYVEASGEAYLHANTFNALAGIKYVW